jgi:hypothetical protein
VLAAAAFAPEASAIPAFARQTSQACSACHFQHFPVLNPVGQEFKAGGFTQMSAKGKIKGEDISIPDNLNAAILFKGRYQKTSGSDGNVAAGTGVPAAAVGTPVVSGTTTNGGQWQVPDELSLFFGGRVGEGEKVKMGFMFEGNTMAAGLVAGLRIPVVIDTGAFAKFLAIPYATDSLGAGYGYELSSTGAVRGVRWAEHRKEVSAAQYVGLGNTAATGVALVAQTSFGYINFSRYSPNFTMSGGTGVQMSSNWIRVAATPTVGDWAMHIGLASLSGSNYPGGALTTNKFDTKGTIVDFQAQGQLGGNDTSLYAQYASAPAGNTTTANYYNGSTAEAKTATTVGIDYSVIPHALHVGGAIRKAKNGKATLNADDAMTLTVVYDLFQNVALHLNHSIYSGSSYNAGGANDTTVTPNMGKSLTTFLLEAAW